MQKIKYFAIGSILIAVFYTLGFDYWERAKEEKSARNLETGVILYDLDGYKFDVPLKYYYLIYQKTGRWPTPKKERQAVKSFEIDVVLPGMLPFSEQTAEKFEARGWRDKMWIVLRSSEYVDDLRWFINRRSKFTVLGPSAEAPGLIHVIDHYGQPVPNDKSYRHLYFKTVDNVREYFYIQCIRNIKEGGVPFPSCTMNTKYGELKLELTFARKYMADWKKILTLSVELLSRFNVKTN